MSCEFCNYQSSLMNFRGKVNVFSKKVLSFLWGYGAVFLARDKGQIFVCVCAPVRMCACVVYILMNLN